jgi:hypothetical protein
MGLDTKTYWLTDRQSQCDFDFDLSWNQTRVEAGSNTSSVTLRVVGGDEKRSLKSEAVKYGYESQGTRTRERLRWRGPTAYTRPLVREGAPQQDRNCQRVINIWSWAPDGARHQDLPTDWPSVAMWLWLWLWLLVGIRVKVIQNRENADVRNIGQGEPRHRKYKRLKLGAGQAYDRSSD